MASLAAAEPLARRSGIALYSAQSAFGTAVTPSTGIGMANLTWNIIGDPQYFSGPGSPDPQAMRPGSSYVEWTLDLESIQTGAKTLLLKVQRASGIVPLFTLGLGVADDAGTPVVAIDQIRDCVIEELTLSGDVSGGHGPITGSLRGFGSFVSRLTSGAAALLSTTPWMTQDVIHTRAASADPLRSFTLGIRNTISRDYVMHGTAPADNPRGYKYSTDHDREFTLQHTRYAESAVAMQAATLSQFAEVFTITNAVDSVALTATYANVSYGNEERRVGQDGVFYSTSGRARGLTLS